jgi:hypothetical protein
MSQGTPITQLRSPPTEDNSKVVDGILQEMEQSGGDNKQSEQPPKQQYYEEEEEHYDNYETELSFTDKIMMELKLPLLVALLVFLSNFNMLNTLLVKYIPRVIGSDGNMNIYGLLLKSVLAGLLFFVVKKFVL